MPNRLRLRNVTFLRCIDGPKMADAFAVLRILAEADVDFVVVNYRRGDEITFGAGAAELVNRIGRIAIEFPNQFARLRLERIKNAVAAGENHLRHTVDHSIS